MRNFFLLLFFLFNFCNLFSESILLCADIDYFNQVQLETKELMTKNGDCRMVLLPETGLNEFYTMPKPDPSVIIRSSCTSSYPSQQAYQAAVALHDRLKKAMDQGTFGQEVIEQTKRVRDRIAKSLIKKTFEQAPHILCMSSATDPEIMVSFLALLRHKDWQKTFLQGSIPSKPLVCNIVVAAGESGRGSCLAARFRHFSNGCSLNDTVKYGDLIDGCHDGLVDLVEIPARDSATGIVYEKNVIEETIQRRVQQAIEHDGQVVVLHMMHSSKTGIGTPSEAFVRRIKELYGDRIVLAVDMAQGRFGDSAIANYLSMNACVFFAGSKFFGGPSFCGMLVVPDQEAACLKSEACHALPKGLKDYFSSYYVDQRLALKNVLPLHPCVGLLLRWHAALCEIDRFYQHSQDNRAEVARTWRAGVEDLIAAYDGIDVLGGQCSPETLVESPSLLAGGCNTIVSFTLTQRNDQQHRKLTKEELRKVYRLMALDSKDLLPAHASDDERAIMQQKCLLGQPALITNTFGALRNALSAPMVSEMLESAQSTRKTIDEVVADVLVKDKIIFEKLAVIMRYVDDLIGQ